MKKFLTLSLFVASLALALNFSGHQSFTGIGSVSLFTAPVTGPYFIDGVLSLPQPSTTGGTERSVAWAEIKKNGSVVYRGVSGATGFAMHPLNLNDQDVVTVSITSNSSFDLNNINRIKGDVFFGNGL